MNKFTLLGLGVVAYGLYKLNEYASVPENSQKICDKIDELTDSFCDTLDEWGEAISAKIDEASEKLDEVRDQKLDAMSASLEGEEDWGEIKRKSREIFEYRSYINGGGK